MSRLGLKLIYICICIYINIYRDLKVYKIYIYILYI